MSWISKLLSANNSEVDIKAALSAGAFVVALSMYAAYGIKGLFAVWDMPSSVRGITELLIAGGVVGAGSTLLNKKLGVDAPCNPPEVK